MTKRNKIIYWTATLWLCLGMLSSAIVQLAGMEEEVKMMDHLGYPRYLLYIIGAWKIAGVLVMLLPRLPLLKEWAYAGFFFAMSGAFFSHFASGQPQEGLPSLLLLFLTALSWHFRPADRKPNLALQNS